MTIGPLDEPVPETESEYGGDGKTGWADDLGQSKGRVLTAGERAAKLRRDADIAAGRREPD
jgi:hypothetical protein